MGRKQKKGHGVPRAKRMNRPARLQSAVAWLKEFDGPMTLMQGIAEAGGFLEEFANKKTIRIVRQVRDGPSRIITVNAESVLYGRRRDLAMRAGDIVFVHPTGLTDWSRKFSQALDPVAGLLGAAGDAAAIVLIAR